MKEPFFSIVTTVYNKEKYIKQCISSIINQTCGDFELIIADDCSSDNTLNIIENFSDKRIKIIKMPQNRGVSHLRNKGLKCANGKYILFADTDDMLENTLLERAKTELLKCQSDILFFPYKYYIEEKNLLKRNNSRRALKNLRKFKKPFKVEEAGKELFNVNYEVWNKVFKREFLIGNEIFFKEDLSFSEDFVFYCDVLNKAKSASYLNKAGYYYRFFAQKKFEKEKVIEQFKKAFSYARIPVETKWGKEFYDKKICSILNYWIVKLNYDKDLCRFAEEICTKGSTLHPKSKCKKIFYKLYYKIKNAL